MMIRGLSLKWKQVIGYFLCKHHLPHETLVQIIEDAISAISAAGFTVRAVIMDQEPCQWKWVRQVGGSPEQPFFISKDNTKVHIIPDPPHLMKNLRNNFSNKEIHFTLNGERMVARWDDVMDLHEKDSIKAVRALPKWTDNHFKLPRAMKMRVAPACQIFSHSAAAAMRMYVKMGELKSS